MAEGARSDPSSSLRSAPGPLPSLGWLDGARSPERPASLKVGPTPPALGGAHTHPRPETEGWAQRPPTSAALRCSSSFPRIRTSTPRQRRDRPRPCSMLSQTTRKSCTRMPTEALGASSRTDAGLCRGRWARPGSSPVSPKGGLGADPLCHVGSPCRKNPTGGREPKTLLVKGQAQRRPTDSPGWSSGGDLPSRGLPFLGSILHTSGSLGSFPAFALGLSPAFLITTTTSALRPKAAGSFNNFACTSSKQ